MLELGRNTAGLFGLDDAGQAALHAALEQQASALFRCLEKQDQHQLDWRYIQNMDPYLLQLVPLDRKVQVYNSTEGLKLRRIVRTFSAAKAKQLIYDIGYRNFLTELAEQSYDYVKNKFIRLCVQAALANRLNSMYWR